jgi:hypothetical protein
MDRQNSPLHRDWVSRQLRGTAPRGPSRQHERRDRSERRRRRLFSLWYGSFHPRRRAPPRRLDDSRLHLVDWYSAHLLPLAMGIALLSMADAFLTTQLLMRGADEVNPVMAALLYKGVAAFTAVKMGLTSLSILFLVVLSRYRFMRLIKVEVFMYIVLIGYLALISYEIYLLSGGFNPLNLQFP